MHKQLYMLALCLAGLLVVGVFSLGFGHVDLSLGELWQGATGPADSPLRIILYELRLPRVLLGMVVGATLGLSGAALQGVLRNPLADPGVIGVSTSAALGAVIAIHLGLGAVWSFYIPIFAMIGAVMATLLLLFVASRDSSVLMLILVGLGISSMATAMISLVINISDSPMSVRDMVMWMMGSLENRTTTDLLMALPFVFAGWLMMLGVGQGLDALSLGEDTASSMGINLLAVKLRIVIGTAVSVGAAVSVCGSIGFVGLVVPHIVRALYSKEPGAILVPSALMGALLLIVADTLTRIPVTDVPLRLGVVTALIGAPCFLFIVYRTRQDMR